MNKKRIVLVLMTVLGINTLSLVSENSKEESQIVYAQETRLTDQSQIDKLSVLRIKTLETSVNSLKNKYGRDIAEVIFKNVNTKDIKNVTTSKLVMSFSKKEKT